MTLSPGARLGPYETLAAIQAGGMGEVCRARDERLDREVAVKALPDALASHRDRLARFECEAKALARLDHPNILAIHDFGREVTGTGATTAYAITELLTGETLAGGPVTAQGEVLGTVGYMAREQVQGTAPMAAPTSLRWAGYSTKS